MPADLEICHFTLSGEFWDETQEFFHSEKQKLMELFKGFEVKLEHVGGSSIPGCLTKKDVDIQVIIQRDDLPAIIEILKTYGKIKNPENWTENKAIFKGIEKSFPTDYLVTVLGTDAEYQYRGARDALKNDPLLLKRYNNLKRKFEGKYYKEYRPEKRNFWESFYRNQLEIKDVR
ncbi:MAG: GrpB family protein [Patescibacteria group bacterium]